ncbi:MAG: hypothetical protein V3V08_15815 [Nannocystaceae bacterium]
MIAVVWAYASLGAVGRPRRAMERGPRLAGGPARPTELASSSRGAPDRWRREASRHDRATTPHHIPSFARDHRDAARSEDDRRIAWLEPAELTAPEASGPALEGAARACRSVLTRLDDVLARPKRPTAAEKRELYRAASDVLSQVSLYTNSEDQDHMSFLEEARAELLARMKALKLEPPL